MDKVEINNIINTDTEVIFRNSTVLQEYLILASRFYFMPVHNIILIHSQFPDAKKIASLKMWQKNGVSVSSGQEGIVILLTDTGIYNDTVKLCEKCVKVFDTAQTDERYISYKRSCQYIFELLKNIHTTAELFLPADNQGYIKEGVICIKNSQTLDEKIFNWLRMYFRYVIYSESEQESEYMNFLASCCVYSVMSVLSEDITVRIYNPYTEGNMKILSDIQHYIYEFWNRFYTYENGSHTVFDFFECNILNRNILSFSRDEFTERLNALKNSNNEYRSQLDSLEYKIKLLSDEAFKALCSDVKNKNIVSTNGYLCPVYETV